MKRSELNQIMKDAIEEDAEPLYLLGNEYPVAK